MSSPLAVGVVLSARPWRGELQRYVRDHVDGVTLRLVRDPRVGMDEAIDVMVVDDEASFLTPAYVAALRARGAKVVGVYDPSEPDEQGRANLARLGVDAVVAAGVGPDELVATLRSLSPESGVDEAFGTLVSDLALEFDEKQHGQVVAVGGPPGAGATEVAAALAEALAKRHSAVLVDLDEVNPGVARRLDLALQPNVLDAIDALQAPGIVSVDTFGGDALMAALAQPNSAGGRQPRHATLAGLANRDDWHLMSGTDVASLLDALRDRFEAVVVNLGPHLEDLSRYVERFAALPGGRGRGRRRRGGV